MTDNRKYLEMLAENIQESLLYVQGRYFVNGDIDRAKVKSLINLVESFSIVSNIEGDSDKILEAESYEKLLVKVIKENSAKRIFEYGFENPFDEDDDAIFISPKKKIGYDNPNPTPEQRKDVQIRKVNLWNKETNNKVMFVNGKMVSGQYFDKGDIIERCPGKLIKRGLYSDDVIDEIAFLADSDRGIYVIPFGYANYYRDSLGCGCEPNAYYVYDEIGGTPYINIIAWKKIRKGDEIVLKSDESDYANVIKKGQFDYSNQPLYTPTKNFTFAS